MAVTLNAAQKAILDAELTVLADSAPEHILTERTAKQLARVAVSSGFKPTKSAFLEAVGDRPFHTLIAFARFIGA